MAEETDGLDINGSGKGIDKMSLNGAWTSKNFSCWNFLWGSSGSGPIAGHLKWTSENFSCWNLLWGSAVVVPKAGHLKSKLAFVMGQRWSCPIAGNLKSKNLIFFFSNFLFPFELV